MSDTAVFAGPTVKEIDPVFDEDAARVFATCAATDVAREIVQAARLDPDSTLLGAFVDGHLAGAYVLRRANLMNEVNHLAIAEAFQRRGLGRMCLYDALFRSGRRPLVVEADDATLPFYKAVGFKLVGKRKAPDGSPRYRLGWHAPMPHPSGTGTVKC